MKTAFFTALALLFASARIYSQCNTALIISQGQPAFASSVENASYLPGNAFDGNRTTRWSSAASDPQYIYVDLGAVTSLCQVNLIWEAAYGKDFTIDISDDASSWTTVATITGNTSLTNNIHISGNGRYVRMNGTARATPNGYSLFGMHVYGTAPSPSCSATNLALGATAIASSTESIAFPPSDAFDGSMSTRWSSERSDPQYIYGDLGSFYNLCSITLSWEAAYAADFTIDVSEDAVTWSNLVTVTGNASTTNTFPVSALSRYVRMNGTARATGYGYSLYEFTVHGYEVLPVKLNAFKASVQSGKYVTLQWATEREINNDHFVIERSSDAIHFYPIGQLKGKGSTAANTTYTWTDSLPDNGINTYRLKQVDKDGKHTYSPVTAITMNAVTRTAVFVYPNPVSDYLTVSSPHGERILNIGLYKTTGEKVLEYRNASDNTATVPMKTIEPGLYIIRVNTSHGIQSFKVLKGSDQ